MFNAINIPSFNQSGGSVLNSTYGKFTIIALVLLFVIASFYLYNRMYGNSFNANYEHGDSYTEDSTNNTAEVMFFYVDWCPHCKTAKPAWEKFSSENRGIKVGNYNVLFTEINCTQETQENSNLMNKYNIEGFPTIIMLKDGDVIQFDAKPTEDTLSQFLNTTLNN